MNEMVERVAKALFEHHYKDDYARFNSGRMLFGTDNPTWEMVISPEVMPEIANRWRAEARAAIEAMREPTNAMLKAGAKGSGEGSEDVAEGAWSYMIDAALSDADQNPR